MPSIDPYLKLAVERNARQLVLTPDQKPTLLFESGKVALGKEVSAVQIAKGVSEIAPAQLRNGLDNNCNMEWNYYLNGVSFRIQTIGGEKGMAVTFTNLGASDKPVAPTVTAKILAPQAQASELTGDFPKQTEPDSQLEKYANMFKNINENKKINEYLMKVLELQASDLHLCSLCKPMFRIDGELKTDRMGAELNPQELVDMIFEIAPPDSFDDFQEMGSCDFGYEFGEQARFRVNVFKEYRGLSAAFRRIPQDIPSAEALKLSPAIRLLATMPKGLVLVTGPTGCGKSTTLASLLDLANRSRTDHIITVEQPIEFVYKNKKCLVHQREIGVHTTGYADALRDALREDPDIVLVGEMRDLETISMAIETAATGHLVFATLHTTTAVSTVDRIIEMYPADRQSQVRTMLADSLKAVISQTLLKKIGGGRVAAMEVLMISPSVANLIREQKTHMITNIMQTGKALGMQQMNDDLIRLVRDKTVEPMEAYRKSVDKLDLVRLFQKHDITFKPPADITILQEDAKIGNREGA